MKYDLEDRLVAFAVTIIRISELLPESKAATHLAGQLVRSGTAPGLLYGEAQGAESRRDFIHKMGIALKELRETKVCLRIVLEMNYLKDSEKLEKSISENIELVSIFAKSISTVEKNLNTKAA